MPTLSAPQNIFLNGLNTKFRAYVGGFGSGKTFVGCLDLLIFFGENPKTKQGYFGPSYPAIRDIFYPTFEEAAELLGFTVDIKQSNKEIHVYRNGFYYGTVICRSMDNPGSIIGFKIARALVDEIDTLKKDKANLAWNKIIARLRLKIDGVINGVGVTTTPEGFLFVYDKFKKDPTKSYSMVQASTYENEIYLPDDYIDSLKETYPDQLINAYLMGEFVNLTTGTVYHQFDRKLNNSNETIKDGEHLYIGMDFNVGKMSSVTHVKRKECAHAVDEIMNGYDTPNMIELIKSKYWRYDGDKYIKTCNIYIYPDASGDSRKSCDASTTDITLLKQAGFFVVVNGANPRVKDRVNSINAMFKNAKGERRYFINTATCKMTTEAFEQQAYNKNGEPDKSSDTDHPVDAAGYFIVHDYKITKPCMPPRIRHF